SITPTAASTENPLLVGLGLSREPQPLTLFIFGASGDLTRRKLIPALFSLYTKGGIPRVRIVGFARRDWTTEAFRKLVREMLDSDDVPEASNELKDAFVENVGFIRSSFESPEGYQAIRDQYSDPPNRIFYLATPPDSYEVIIERLHEAGLTDQSQGFARIIVEKPLGRDLTSARLLNDRIAAAFTEGQTYRIDHYLGKETVQNIMLMRFGNGIFEPVWNNSYIDHVQITMAETIGIGSRGRYYEQAGALRDMMQNHMLTLLCLVAMEPPVDLKPDSIHDEKVKVLRSIAPIGAEQVATETVRGQYEHGLVDGTDVPGYRQEQDVSPDSATETFAALRLRMDSWRWAGVPFLLRTGKRLSRRTTEISIHFKRPPLLLFADRHPAGTPPNVLTFRIQPQEGIMMGFNSKIPGPSTDMRTVNMDFSYGSAFGEELPDAYERLLLDAMVGDSTLYMRKDEVDSAWAFITEILTGWHDAGTPEISFYRAGSSGPEAATRLLGASERRWRRL
ncbi:MAG TPA: glucose-6-phosphate dehydrogenase, partial [Spirochaetia bacterium]|nr:glucose-6-phosphate dehydrogenase [Spirochaetia bacterium]